MIRVNEIVRLGSTVLLCLLVGQGTARPAEPVVTGAIAAFESEAGRIAGLVSKPIHQVIERFTADGKVASRTEIACFFEKRTAVIRTYAADDKGEMVELGSVGMMEGVMCRVAKNGLIPQRIPTPTELWIFRDALRYLSLEALFEERIATAKKLLAPGILQNSPDVAASALDALSAIHLEQWKSTGEFTWSDSVTKYSGKALANGLIPTMDISAGGVKTAAIRSRIAPELVLPRRLNFYLDNGKRVYMDFKDTPLTFPKGAKSLGFAWTLEKGFLLVTQIAAGSPADKAKLVQGAKLRAVNGVSVEQLDMPAIMTLFQGETCKLQGDSPDGNALDVELKKTSVETWNQ